MKPLITILPITTWSGLRAAFRELLTHPSLGETAEWFASYLEEDIHDEALGGCWSSIESDFRHDERDTMVRVGAVIGLEIEYPAE